MSQEPNLPDELIVLMTQYSNEELNYDILHYHDFMYKLYTVDQMFDRARMLEEKYANEHIHNIAACLLYNLTKQRMSMLNILYSLPVSG